MNKGISDIMCPSHEIGVESMPEFHCVGCGHVKGIQFPNHKPGDILRGIIKCSDCGERTFFEIVDNVWNPVPGNLDFGSFNTNVPSEAKDRFMEAKECYYGTALRASAVMARSSVEFGLAGRGFTSGTLEKRINDAHNAKVLENTEYVLAHGTRLVGRNAIHKALVISPAQVVAVLSATVEILNKLFP